MRNDSRNLLAKLDRSDFQYRSFWDERQARDEGHYGWPLLDIVYQAAVGERRAQAAAQEAAARQAAAAAAAAAARPPIAPFASAHGYASPPAHPHAASPAPVEAQGDAGLFGRYAPPRPVPPMTPPPAPAPAPAASPAATQDLSSLLQSYSGKR
ncbi:hypothetical protein PQ455_17100 [Sphingomonas naphthae]|uniref:Uncharacterized protein n=1 Tax=Sphingomonas naphthae TaxID=1813468 RepID=A0ABY7TJA4_9SPHN|nr:hypothetical protein [Sphingomonas naphthae]WCT73308.1 hypothetical protein PQ455_17100 [Sphingomonas naphthae]